MGLGSIMWGRGRRSEPSSFCGSFFNFSWCLDVITEKPSAGLAWVYGLVTWEDSGGGRCTKRVEDSCQV